MIQFRDMAQAINTNQADIAFGMVAAADIDHRNLHGVAMSPACSGKRRRLSKRMSYSMPVPPVCPGTRIGTTTGRTACSRWRTGQAGGRSARLWATLVLQRALSS